MWIAEGEVDRLNANEKRLKALAALFEVPIEHLGTVISRIVTKQKELMELNAKLHADNATLIEELTKPHAVDEVTGAAV